jgi:hypothetical protein
MLVSVPLNERVTISLAEPFDILGINSVEANTSQVRQECRTYHDMLDYIANDHLNMVIVVNAASGQGGPEALF